MSVNIRPALPADLPSVVGFTQTEQELYFSFPKAIWPLSLEQLAEAMATRQGSTVAVLDGEIAGFANFYQCQPDEFCALGNLMIAPWARGKGVAQALIGAMERLAREQFNARFLRASCFNQNSAGLLLYPKLGYTVDAIVERQNHQGQRVALIQFSKSLLAAT
ncbi:GNAT family N-acetyltransferase [Pseudomonas sp. MS19]|uniref:GNAT family N-acetyltransferase n=1 Tax=Pseudomonas sp. MS19 TaxID=2579939 RepID=UPI001D9F4D15|nr:GNAT family N-acetyltransferase [Pseudomonas sp. MS19]